jgi:hypothetical protein
MVALYLRSTGRYLPTRASNFTLQYNRGLFWQEAARVFVLSIRRVTELAATLAEQRNDPSIVALAFSAHRRIARAFERRDSAWRLIDQPQDLDVADDLRAAIETVLTYLMGAADATARLVDRALRIGTVNPSWIGWQNARWIRAVGSQEPALAEIVATKSSGSAIFEILRLLRNLIHAEGLDSVTFRHPQRARATSTQLLLSAEDQLRLLELMAQAGGAAAWGRRDDIGDRASFDVGELLDTLLREVLGVLDSMMKELEVVLIKLGATPLPPAPSNLNDALVGQHLRWQLGLASDLEAGDGRATGAATPPSAQN